MQRGGGGALEEQGGIQSSCGPRAESRTTPFTPPPRPQVALCDRKRNPSCRLSSMFDLSNCSLSNMDAAVMGKILGILGTHYVERLSVLYFYNPPALFWGLWNSTKHLLPEVRLVERGGGAAGAGLLSWADLDCRPAGRLPAVVIT
jgi:hypothetical protein